MLWGRGRLWLRLRRAGFWNGMRAWPSAAAGAGVLLETALPAARARLWPLPSASSFLSRLFTPSPEMSRCQIWTLALRGRCLCAMPWTFSPGSTFPPHLSCCRSGGLGSRGQRLGRKGSGGRQQHPQGPAAPILGLGAHRTHPDLVFPLGPALMGPSPGSSATCSHRSARPSSLPTQGRADPWLQPERCHGAVPTVMDPCLWPLSRVLTGLVGI